jgi:hypothetical protein
MCRLTLLWSIHRPIGSMGAPSACRGEIFQATTFLASPRMNLYLCLCSWLLKLGSVMQVSNDCVKECQVVTASHGAILVQYERYV